MYTTLKLSLKNSFQSQKHYNPGSEKQNVTLSTKLFFYNQKNDTKKRLRNQSPRGFTRKNKKQPILHWCNIFRHLHQQNASGRTVAKKTRNHVTFPRHTWILHVTVTF